LLDSLLQEKSTSKMPILHASSPSEKKVKDLSKVDQPYDVKFIFNQQEQPAERQEIEAHRFVLALGSEIFRLQFYGGLPDNPGKEIEIQDWSFYDFKIFINSFYTEVNLENSNIMTLCELYYIGDFYNVSELKTKVIETLSAPEKDVMYEELLGIDLAIIAHTNTGIYPDLSDVLYKKVRYIIEYSCGRQTENIENFFNEHRDLFDSSTYDEVIQAVVVQFGPCQNCLSKSPFGGNCVYPPYLDWSNFRPGALVINQPSVVNKSELNQRVYRLGQADPDTSTFSAFDKFGEPLPPIRLRFRDFMFNCSAGNADPSVISSID
jgi:hypothetical protein